MSADDGVDAARPPGYQHLAEPDYPAYQAILRALAADDTPATLAEVAERAGGTAPELARRLDALVAWGTVSRTERVGSIAEYRRGAVRFALSELGSRVWRDLARAGAGEDPHGTETGPGVPTAALLRLARWCGEADDAGAHALASAVFGWSPAPARPGIDSARPPRSRADGARVRARLAARVEETVRIHAEAAAELRDACAELHRTRISEPALRLLVDLIGRALARANDGDDAYLADTRLGLELQLLRSPGTQTTLCGAHGVFTLDGFKLRLAGLADGSP